MDLLTKFNLAFIVFVSVVAIHSFNNDKITLTSLLKKVVIDFYDKTTPGTINQQKLIKNTENMLRKTPEKTAEWGYLLLHKLKDNLPFFGLIKKAVDKSAIQEHSSPFVVLTFSFAICLLLSGLLTRVYTRKVRRIESELHLPVIKKNSSNHLIVDTDLKLFPEQRERIVENFLLTHLQPDNEPELNKKISNFELKEAVTLHDISLISRKSRTSISSENGMHSGRGESGNADNDDVRNDGNRLAKNHELGDGLCEKDFQDYVFLKDLQSNCAFSDVSLRRRITDSKKLVIRTYHSSSKFFFDSELKILEVVKDSPFVIQVLNHFQSESGRSIVLEYVSGGSLLNLLRNKGFLNTEDARFYLAEIMLAVDFLHRKGIVLKDLKAEKVMLDSTGHIVLVHFHGASLEVANLEGQSDEDLGFNRSESPENVQIKLFGPKVDVWALGILMFEMLIGRNPFLKDTVIATEKAILHGIFPIEFLRNLEKLPASLIQLTLKKNPEARISLKEMFRHPFFDQVDWADMSTKNVPPPFRPRTTL